MVQKHAARRLHYDFRLEWNGTLWSWAVPQGPSRDPKVKRLAVHVEDHPVEYADFEGSIPEGNYGAGTVIVWDKGLWVPIDDPDTAMEEGKLHFELRGYKLRGEWILVRPKRRAGSADEWLLIKKEDPWARAGEEDGFAEESILSGLTVEELREGRSRAGEVRQRLARLGAPDGRVDARAVELMLARTRDAPFSDPEWLFELKYDGYRLLAQRSGGEAYLRSRNGHDITAVYPDIARAVAALPYEHLVLDGELVVLDEEGRPDFHRLQRRSQLRRQREVERATVELPATLFCFDLVGFEDRDPRPLPLEARKECLRELLPRSGPLRYADHIPERGEAMFARVGAMGLEGIIAKRADAPYRGGRSSQWLKLVADRTGDFVVCGFTEPRGGRAGFGALILAGHDDQGRLIHAGRVGTGFDTGQLEEMRAALEAMRQSEPSCAGPLPRGVHWVRPVWVAEVQYKTVTDEGFLRAPVFVRLRDDKDPAECGLPAPPASAEEPSPAAAREVAADAAGKEIRFTNLDKIFWPEDGLTKGDLIEYYRSVSAWLLPYLRDRPLVLTRYPDGIHGKSFYQKNVPDYLPAWIRTESVWSESVEKQIEYLVCNDEETLLYVANMASIPLHVWPSRVHDLQRPDWCILDLDPKGAPFENVRTLALAIRELCDEIGVETFVKTSGSTGLHVLLPLGGRCTFEQSRMLGQLIARVTESRHPEIATTTRNIAARRGRVYLDFLQNRHGQLLVAPYSVRPLPGAPVSAPLEWREVNARLTPQRHTLKNIGARLKRRQSDPLAPILDARPDLVAALEALAGHLDHG